MVDSNKAMGTSEQKIARILLLIYLRLRRSFRALLHLLNGNAIVLSAIASIIIAIYSITSFGIQSKLETIQDQLLRMQSEPTLVGQIWENFRTKDTVSDYNYHLTNTGDDTAWSVFTEIRELIVTDTILIYTNFYAHGIIRRGSVYRGEFSKQLATAPTETSKIGFGRVPSGMLQLSKALKSPLVVYTHTFYWGDSPRKRYEFEQYFLYNKRPLGPDGHMEEVVDPRDTILQTIRFLGANHNIAVAQPTGLLFSAKDTLILLARPTPSYSGYDLPWTFRDTILFHDTTFWKKETGAPIPFNYDLPPE